MLNDLTRIRTHLTKKVCLSNGGHDAKSSSSCLEILSNVFSSELDTHDADEEAEPLFIRPFSTLVLEFCILE